MQQKTGQAGPLPPLFSLFPVFPLFQREKTEYFFKFSLAQPGRLWYNTKALCVGVRIFRPVPGPAGLAEEMRPPEEFN